MINQIKYGSCRDTNQRKVESHIIGEALFNYKILDALKKEDFKFYRKEFEIINTCKGDQLKMITDYPDLYKIQDSIVYLSLNIDHLVTWLTESTFKSTLENVLSSARGNTLDITESVLYDELVTKIKYEDIFDLIDFLPEYMDSIGLPNEMVKKWGDYCLKRVEEIKEFVNNKKWL